MNSDMEDNKIFWKTIITLGRLLPFCGKTRVMSIAANPFLPTLPCCCFIFQAVFGKPELKSEEKSVRLFLGSLPMLTERFKSLTSSPIEATSVETKTEQALKQVLV
jgi:hypothetical protein